MLRDCRALANTLRLQSTNATESIDVSMLCLNWNHGIPVDESAGTDESAIGEGTGTMWYALTTSMLGVGEGNDGSTRKRSW